MNADSIKYFLTQLETADNKSKAEIENMLVNVGSAAVPVLVEQLQTVKGAVRGVVAMTLIRIGEPSVACLKKVAQNNKDFEWVAKYIIKEISTNKFIKFLNSNIGTEQEVLIEKRLDKKTGLYKGVTRNYINVLLKEGDFNSLKNVTLNKLDVVSNKFLC